MLDSRFICGPFSCDCRTSEAVCPQAGWMRMLGAGIEPAWEFVPRDFKSLASTGFATRAERRASPIASVKPVRLHRKCDSEPEEKRSGKRDSNPRPQPWQG